MRMDVASFEMRRPTCPGPRIYGGFSSYAATFSRDFPFGSRGQRTSALPMADAEQDATEETLKGEGGKQTKDLDTVTDYVESREMVRGVGS